MAISLPRSRRASLALAASAAAARAVISALAGRQRPARPVRAAAAGTRQHDGRSSLTAPRRGAPPDLGIFLAKAAAAPRRGSRSATVGGQPVGPGWLTAARQGQAPVLGLPTSQSSGYPDNDQQAGACMEAPCC